MIEDISKMSNQERINAMGLEAASQYHGPYSRRGDGVEYHPAITHEGANWDNQKNSLENKLNIKVLEKMPREYIIPTHSFKKNRKEEVEVKSNFKRSDIVGRFKDRFK